MVLAEMEIGLKGEQAPFIPRLEKGCGSSSDHKNDESHVSAQVAASHLQRLVLNACPLRVDIGVGKMRRWGRLCGPNPITTGKVLGSESSCSTRG